jgi:hypothetical protein
MSLKNKNCPYFFEGKCNKNKCIYKYHIVCINNYSCIDINCKKGHGITFIKRKIIDKLYEKFYNNIFDNSKNKCIYPMRCYNKSCKNEHHLEYDERLFILKIFSNINDKENIELYNKIYNNIDNIIQFDNIEKELTNLLKDE